MSLVLMMMQRQFLCEHEILLTGAAGERIKELEGLPPLWNRFHVLPYNNVLLRVQKNVIVLRTPLHNSVCFTSARSW